MAAAYEMNMDAPFAPVSSELDVTFTLKEVSLYFLSMSNIAPPTNKKPWAVAAWLNASKSESKWSTLNVCFW